MNPHSCLQNLKAPIAASTDFHAQSNLPVITPTQIHNFAPPADAVANNYWYPYTGNKEAIPSTFELPKTRAERMLENFEFEMAENFVNHTAAHIFLTGKAGTGKTTFLREVIGKTTKKCVVVAPTGVAAINAGGTTIHSMFGLPTKSYIPSFDFIDPNLGNNQSTMSRHFHYSRQKLDVIQGLELLVIDEVSMVRADILDAVDFALRYSRKNPNPFGGVQVLFIGDMYQLPPVIKDDEWPVMSKYYSAPFFFNSLAFQKLEPVYIELKKIYRQTDRQFINILNNIRHQDFQQEDYDVLKEHYNPDFQPDEPGYITLTTHNKKAEAMNEKELQKLAGEEQIFDANVDGDFGDNMFPTERLLRLKKGAQVMFVKNDTSGERKYFNGKIGIVETIDPYAEEGEELSVRFPDSGEIIFVKKELWENIRYSLNSDDNKLEQNRIGSFTQYPLRLAWAITIHKSQGLTFEKAVIDAGESFSPGQVYVALSRCTSMDYLVLKSMISSRNILSDPRIVDFSNRIMKEHVLENKLEEAKKKFAFEELLKTFDFMGLRNAVSNWDKTVTKIKSINRADTFQRTNRYYKNIEDIQALGMKFHSQLQAIFNSGDTDEMRAQKLKERCDKAIVYFTEFLESEIISGLNAHLNDVKLLPKLKKYGTETRRLYTDFVNKKKQLYGCEIEGERVYRGEINVPAIPDKVLSAKGGTYDVTLELYKSGKTMAEIASMRSMAESTIGGHFARLITKNEIQVNNLLSQEKIELIAASVKEHGMAAIVTVKQALDESISFAEIRWVMAGIAAEQIKG